MSRVGTLEGQISLDAKAFDSAVKKVQEGLRGLERESSKTSDTLGKSKGASDKAAQGLKSVGEASLLTKALVVGLSGAMFAVSAGFEKAMVSVAAKTPEGLKALKSLKAAALDYAAVTEYMAKDVAAGMEFLAQSGMSANRIIGAMPSVMQLATAGAMDLAQAADTVTNIMAGYQLQVADLAHVNDLLVSASTGANTNIQQLGEAFKYAGPVAKAAGVDFEEALAAMALMGNAGIQASMAGTSLRGMLSRLSAPTKQVQETLKALGVEALDGSGRLKDLSEIMRQFAPHADNVGALMTVFGQRAGPAFAALLGQGADALDAFKERLGGADGLAKSIQDAQLDTVAGQFAIVASQVERLVIDLGTALAPATREVTGWIQALLGYLIELEPSTVRTAAGLAAVAAALTLVKWGLAAITAHPVIAGVAALSVALLGLVDLWKKAAQAYQEYQGSQATEAAGFAADPIVQLGEGGVPERMMQPELGINSEVIPVLNAKMKVIGFVDEHGSDLSRLLAEYIPGMDAMGKATSGFSDFMDEAALSMQEMIAKMHEAAEEAKKLAAHMAEVAKARAVGLASATGLSDGGFRSLVMDPLLEDNEDSRYAAAIGAGSAVNIPLPTMSRMDAESALSPTLAGAAVGGLSDALGGVGASLSRFGASMPPIVGEVGAAVAEFGAGIVGQMGGAGQALATAMSGDWVGGLMQLGVAAASTTEGFGKIMGSLEELLGLVGNALAPLFDALAPIFAIVNTLLAPVLKAVGVVLKALAPLFDAVRVILEPFVPLFEAIGGLLEALAPVLELVSLAVGGIVSLIMVVLAPILDALATVIGWISDVIEWVVGIIKDVARFFIDLWNGLVEGIADVADWIGLGDSIRSLKISTDALGGSMGGAAKAADEFTRAAAASVNKLTAEAWAGVGGSSVGLGSGMGVAGDGFTLGSAGMTDRGIVLDMLGLGVGDVFGAVVDRALAAGMNAASIQSALAASGGDADQVMAWLESLFPGATVLGPLAQYFADLGDSTGELTENMEAANAALSNVPEIWKVERERFRALDADARGVGGSSASATVPGGGFGTYSPIFVEHVTVQTNDDPTAAWEAIEREGERRRVIATGTPIAGANGSIQPRQRRPM